MQSNVGEYWLIGAGIDVLVAEVRPVGPEPAGNLAVPPGRFVGVAAFGAVPHYQSLVEPLKSRRRVNNVGGQDRFANRSRLGVREQLIPIYGKSDLQSRNLRRPRKQLEVESFGIRIIDYVLDRFLSEGRARFPAVAYLGNVVKSKRTGRNTPIGFQSDIMNRQDAPSILEIKQQRPPCRCLQPGAVVIRRVVIPDRGVIATGREIEILVSRVGQKIALDVHAERVLGPPCDSVNVVRPGFEDNFTQEFELVGNVGGHKEVELTEGKSCLVAGKSGGMIVIAVESHIAKSPDAQ